MATEINVTAIIQMSGRRRAEGRRVCDMESFLMVLSKASRSGVKGGFLVLMRASDRKPGASVVTIAGEDQCKCV